MENPIYLGDGLYAYFDGYGIELRLGSHDAECAVYLEPTVFDALAAFRERTKQPR
jgi:hypothetical protein